VKFRCERDVLVDALATAGRAVSSRGGSLPVLSGVLLQLNGDHLQLTGSDLDLTITVETTVAGQSDGVAVLPAKLASDITRSFGSGAIHVEVQNDEARLSSGRSEFALRLMHADEYPKFEPPSGDAVTLQADRLATALRQVVRAASSDDSRPILTGVLMAAEAGGLRLVATDSYRLAVCDLPGEAVLGEGQQVLVPSRALNELAKVLAGAEQVTLRLGARDASFTIGGVNLTTRLIEGEFPNYRGLIPSNHPNQVTIEREALLEALRRVRLLAQEATPLRINMMADAVELRAVTQDVGEAHEVLDATCSGQELMVAFNPQYLLDGVEVTPGEHVTLETVDALKPALLRSVDSPDFLYLLMPVRVS
jgi:DNA polymerase III subunit beta